MYKQVLKENLIKLGYYPLDIDQKIEKLNKQLNNINYNETEIDSKLEIIKYEKPNQEILKFYLNKNEIFEKVFVLDGKINVIEKLFENSKQFIVADYNLSENLCVVGFTKDKNIKILLYLPNNDTIVQYTNCSYEDIFGLERNNMISDCITSLSAKQTLSLEESREIVYILSSEFVIDKMIISNHNPKFKLYNDAEQFAEAITSYHYKYIDKFENCVKIIDKSIDINYLGNGVVAGNLSNEPYLQLNEVNQTADFKLTVPSYAWILKNEKRTEELAIYTAKKEYKVNTYRELLNIDRENKLREEAEKLCTSFSSKIGYFVSIDYILDVLKKLNSELIIFPINKTKKEISINLESIEPIKYKYKLTTNPEEFEQNLYRLIDDNLNGRYKYRLVERLSGLYTMIGNKIKYTSLLGEQINRHTIADFNKNANAAVIKKESFLTNEIIDLLNDKKMDKNVMDSLPVPVIEVLFYFPKKENISNEVEMFNGSDIKYVFDFINKSETITNLEQQNIQIKQEDTENELEIKEEKRMVNVEINYVTALGEKLKPSMVQSLPVGTAYQPQNAKIFIDNSGIEWMLANSNPNSFIISENEEENIINLVYGNAKANIKIFYKAINGIELRKSEEIMALIDERYTHNIESTILDDKGLQWKYVGETNPTIYVEKSNENSITLVYEEHKQNVRIQYTDEDGNRIKEDKIIEKQIGEKIVITAEKNHVDDQGRAWKTAANNEVFKKVLENEEDNIVVIKYLPVLENVIIVFQDRDGNEIKARKIESIQLGMEFKPEPTKTIKDKKGNEWQLVEKEYPSIIVTENEKENIINYTYDVAKARVTIKYLKTNGEKLKSEEHLLKQVGSGMVPTPEALIYDNENKCWKLAKVHPAMLKVASENNEITVMYEEAKVKVIWKFMDMNGNRLKEDEVQKIQVGTKYTPIINERVIYKSDEVWKLMEIKPYEIIVSENERENVVELIYSNAK